MFDNGGLVKLRRMGVVMYCWIKHATRRKKEPCPKCRKRKVQKMLSLTPSAMERLNYELALQRDRFVRLQSVRNDLALDLPHSIHLPDGEEIPYGSSTRLKIRDPQQESEITDTCVRPPPNRTLSRGEVEPLPPYVTYLATGKRPKRSGDLLERTARCLGMKRGEEPVPLPPPQPPLCVHVPINRSRQLAAFAKNNSMDLDSVPGVSCAVPAQHMPENRPMQDVAGALPDGDTGSQVLGATAAPAATAGAAAVASASAGPSAVAGTSASAGPSTVAGTSASAGPSTVAGTSASAGPSTVAGTSASAGPSAVAGTSASAGPSTVAGTSASAGPSAVAGTSASAGPSTVAGTSAAAAAKPASAISSASALSDYIDTKGPETREERMRSAYYTREYYGTKAADKSYDRGAAAVALGSSTSEQQGTRGAEKKGDKGTV